ncbi:MAG TPA: flagellar biosynthesis protein FlhF [Pirellulales bacterium]|nr:flagellar biosynthesis protein FlhF [Pirellulales bacterium]
MNVRTFRASTMQEALAQVRRELGPDAAVLHTREMYGSAPLRWIPGLRKIEVTAAVDVNVPSRLATTSESKPRGEPAAPVTGVRAASPRTIHRRDAAHHDMQNQLSHLQAMVEDLCRRTRGTQQDLPDAMFQLYTGLIDVDIQEERARSLVERVRNDAMCDGVEDVFMLRAHLAHTIENELSVSGPLKIEPGRCRLVALVGPTGVGKTTTIAKLAANYRLREKRKVGLITVDTYRIAAVEQLRTYADIIDLPMQVVSTPREMREAARAMADLDLVLLDTAGRSPKDEVKIQELKSFLSEAKADEVHLVLSSVASAMSLEQTARRFADVGTTALVLTKLDEATSFGHLLPLLTAPGLPLSYVTDGQNVPDDIAPADRTRLAKLILGMNAQLTTEG